MPEERTNRAPGEDLDARTLAGYTNLARAGAIAEAEDLRQRIAAAVTGVDLPTTVVPVDAFPAGQVDDPADVLPPEAITYGSTAIFRNGDDAGMLWANTLVDAGGEAAVTIEPDDLEALARIAAPRM
ncbi:MAG: hypothetical protein EOL89_02485 [Actinobacteria bacterium]|nr:hypothetical protein [Actinomycetota bacterium]